MIYTLHPHIKPQGINEEVDLEKDKTDYLEEVDLEEVNLEEEEEEEEEEEVEVEKSSASQSHLSPTDKLLSLVEARKDGFLTNEEFSFAKECWIKENKT